MSSLKIPKRKKLRQKTISQETETNINDLVSKKKRRIERQKTDSELEQLFQHLQQDVQAKERNGEYGSDYIPQKQLFLQDLDQSNLYLEFFDDNFMLNCEQDSDQEQEQEESSMKETAKLYLDQDAQENLSHALQVSKNNEVIESKDSWYQQFFNYGVKNIRQPSLISKQLSSGNKEIHISELSASSKGRAYLLQTGCLKDWFRSGWKCPNYIVQWLFEVVGLDIDKITAKNALSTLFEIWSLDDHCSQDILYTKNIELSTFTAVLKAYDCIPSQLTERFYSSASFMSVEEEVEQASVEIIGQDIQRKYIPLSQLGWMVKAFGYSVRLFKKSYTTSEIRYMIRLLLQISLDRTGCLVINDIQLAIDNCLSSLDEASWETEVKTIANDICDLVTSSKRQVHLFHAVKTMNQRSRYFRRMIGLTCLERCLNRDIPGSINYISTDQPLIQQISQIFHYPNGFFKKCTKEMDYEECFLRVAMLDAAIGTDDADIKKEKDTVLKMADELRDISLQMGARLGVMKKTLANEMIQRVWSRISYAAGRKSNFEL